MERSGRALYLFRRPNLCCLDFCKSRIQRNPTSFWIQFIDHSNIHLRLRAKHQRKNTQKQDEVLGGKFDSQNYRSERILAPSRDGKTEIPVSLVYHKDFAKSGDEPLLLYGYGSYGNTIDPWFSSARLSLLDRGFRLPLHTFVGGRI